tara:strand:- start:173 stop:331 length:159 start_codon:yes stop_codon:yes gene_type:complete
MGYFSATLTILGGNGTAKPFFIQAFIFNINYDVDLKFCIEIFMIIVYKTVNL